MDINKAMHTAFFHTEVLPLRDRLFRLACQMLAEEEEAEDAVQEVYLKLWTMRESLAGYRSVAAIATTMTRNLCIDKLRVRNRTGSLDVLPVTAQAPENPYLDLERRDTVRLLQQIIEQLPPLQQSILRMKDIESYEIDEIAQITGSTNEAIRTNLSRARKRVRETYLRITNTNRQ